MYNFINYINQRNKGVFLPVKKKGKLNRFNKMKDTKRGRPSLNKQKCNLYLTADVIDYINTLGNGSPSAGVTDLVEWHKKRAAKTDL